MLQGKVKEKSYLSVAKYITHVRDGAEWKFLNDIHKYLLPLCKNSDETTAKGFELIVTFYLCMENVQLAIEIYNLIKT